MHLRFRDFKLAANLELLNRRRFLVKRNVSGRVIGCMVSDLCNVCPYRQLDPLNGLELDGMNYQHMNILTNHEHINHSPKRARHE